MANGRSRSSLEGFLPLVEMTRLLEYSNESWGFGSLIKQLQLNHNKSPQLMSFRRGARNLSTQEGRFLTPPGIRNDRVSSFGYTLQQVQQQAHSLVVYRLTCLVSHQQQQQAHLLTVYALPVDALGMQVVVVFLLA